MLRLELIIAAASVALLAACGEPSDTTTTGEPATETDPATSGPTSGPTTGSTSEPTTTEPTTTEPTTTEPTTGEGLTCDMFGFVNTQPLVQVTLRNDRATPVYVYNWVFCGRPVVPLEIVDVTSPDVPLNWWLDQTEDECTEFGCGCEGGGESTPDSVIKLATGGTYTETWPGKFYTAIEAPAECVGETVCAASCLLGQQAPEATYRVRATGGTEVVGGSDCDPDPMTGSCQLIDGFTPGGATLEAKAELAYPGVTALELVFTD